MAGVMAEEAYPRISATHRFAAIWMVIQAIGTATSDTKLAHTSIRVLVYVTTLWMIVKTTLSFAATPKGTKIPCGINATTFRMGIGAISFLAPLPESARLRCFQLQNPLLFSLASTLFDYIFRYRAEAWGQSMWHILIRISIYITVRWG